jgi:uncharacterized membrane protein
MDIKRIARHLFYAPWRVGRAFPAQSLDAIERAIRASETTHGGEIRFAVEGALDGAPLFKGQSARERAIDAFSLLRIWDTERNNGVLIYLLLADHDVEIVADRGISAHVGSQEWEAICRMMEVAFRASQYEKGVIAGIEAVTGHLARHFPAGRPDRNELPDRAVVL